MRSTRNFQGRPIIRGNEEQFRQCRHNEVTYYVAGNQVSISAKDTRQCANRPYEEPSKFASTSNPKHLVLPLFKTDNCVPLVRMPSTNTGA